MGGPPLGRQAAQVLARLHHSHGEAAGWGPDGPGQGLDGAAGRRLQEAEAAAQEGVRVELARLFPVPGGGGGAAVGSGGGSLVPAAGGRAGVPAGGRGGGGGGGALGVALERLGRIREARMDSALHSVWAAPHPP